MRIFGCAGFSISSRIATAATNTFTGRPRRKPRRSRRGGVHHRLARVMLSDYNDLVIVAVQLQLLPSKDAAIKLEATMRRFNAAANWLAGEAFALKSGNKIALQKTHYAALRERFGLSAQMAVRCIAEVCSAYKRDRSIRPRFRPLAAVPYDQRIASFKSLARISLLTLEGRILVPFVMGKYQRGRFTAAKGQCDLVRRKDGKWFLLVTVDLPENVRLPASDFLGVDFGVVNIATTSDGTTYSGTEVEACRSRYSRLRRSLQQAASAKVKAKIRPKNIRRKLKSLSCRESRFRRDVNHCISKTLVARAKDTARGIAGEDLTYIRDRTRFRKPQRARMSGWAFFQLRAFVTYKSILAGVDLRMVDPRGTSRTCNPCGNEAKSNRKSQAEFVCGKCGHAENADLNAARNIRSRALVNAPIVAELCAA
jgi:putative transposase